MWLVSLPPGPTQTSSSALAASYDNSCVFWCYTARYLCGFSFVIYISVAKLHLWIEIWGIDEMTDALLSLISYAATWTDKDKDTNRRMSGSTTNQLPSNKDYLADFLVWKPPVGFEKNRAFWVSLTLWIGLVGAALLLQKWSLYTLYSCYYLCCHSCIIVSHPTRLLL